MSKLTIIFYIFLILAIHLPLPTTSLHRNQKEKDQINVLFAPKPKIVPMKYIEVLERNIISETVDHLNFMYPYYKFSKSKLSELQNMEYTSITHKLDLLYGFSPSYWETNTLEDIDDGSKIKDPNQRNVYIIKDFVESVLAEKNGTDNDLEFLKSMEGITHSNSQKLPDLPKLTEPKPEKEVSESDIKSEDSKPQVSQEPKTPETPEERKKLQKLTGACVENAESLSIKEYLKAFAKSRCSPVIISPGIFATKLIVEINCEKLRDNSPELFRTCGWTSCSSGLLNSVPKKEYTVWVPDFLGDLNLISMNHKKNNCWVELFANRFDSEAIRNNDLQNVLKDTWEDGWRVRLFGDSEGSRPNNKCGSSAIEYLLPYNITVDMFGGTKSLMVQLRLMGYRDGLTMQAMPFDFRVASNLNFGFKKSFMQSLKRIKKLTGKKSILINHSFGTVYTYSNLLDMTHEEKEDLVEFWAPVDAPLMGNVFLMGATITGENPFTILNGLIGLSKPQAMNAFFGISSSMEMLPFNYWKFINEKWFQEFVIKRMLAETLPEHFEISRPTFFPDPSNECYKKLLGSSVNCHFLKSIYPDKDIVSIRNKSYNLSQIHEFLFDLHYTYLHDKDVTLNALYDLTQGNYRDYPHPGVPVVGFFINSKPTMASMFLDEDVLDYHIREDQIKTFYQTGDGTVESYSTIIPMMKWAYEYSYEGQEAQQPVKFVDICSQINRKYHPFDSTTYDDVFTTNEYIGKFSLFIFSNG